MIAEYYVGGVNFGSVVGKRLWHTAGKHNHRVWQFAAIFSDCLARFSVAFGGYCARIDNKNVRLSVGQGGCISGSDEHTLHRCRFVLINLATECVKCKSHLFSSFFIKKIEDYSAAAVALTAASLSAFSLRSAAILSL